MLHDGAADASTLEYPDRPCRRPVETIPGEIAIQQPSIAASCNDTPLKEYQGLPCLFIFVYNPVPFHSQLSVA